MSHIFISYASEDRGRVSRLVYALKEAHYEVWWDRKLLGGQVWSQEILKQLVQARCVIVVWTGVSILKHWVLEEAEVGLDRGKLIPVNFDIVTPPFGFKRLQKIDFTDWDETVDAYPFKQLVRSIENLVASPIVASPMVTTIETRRRSALKQLETLILAIRERIGHGHDFKNKNDWQKELFDFADRYRDWIGDLYLPTKMIAWRIRDHSFNHENKESSQYCCDELIADLRALQLLLLSEVRSTIPNEEVDKKAQEILSDITLMELGVAPNSEITKAMQKKFEKWKAGQLEFGKEFAVSTIVTP